MEQRYQTQLFDPFLDPSLPTKDRRFISIYLRADNKFRIYKREVDTIMDYFGEIGGFYEIVIGTGTLLTACFMSRSMNSEMIKEVY